MGNCRQRAEGLTLIEVLVAMFMLAIVAVACLNLLTSASISRQHRQQAFLASLVAENQFVRLQLADKDSAVTGASHGSAEQGGSVFYWQLTHSETPVAAFRRIDIAVYADAQRDTPLVSQSMLMVMP